MSSLPFWYLRHGETDWNARGLSQGNVEVPLNETGRAQARAAGGLLAGKQIVSIVASPMGRAQETAALVAERLGLPVATEEMLRETSFGVQEGEPMGGWFDDWIAGVFTPEGAESFTELRRRATVALARALNRPAPVLVVAHGALFRALRAEWGTDPNIRTANGVAMLCSPSPDGWTVEPA